MILDVLHKLPTLDKGGLVIVVDLGGFKGACLLVRFHTGPGVVLVKDFLLVALAHNRDCHIDRYRVVVTLHSLDCGDGAGVVALLTSWLVLAGCRRVHRLT